MKSFKASPLTDGKINNPRTERWLSLIHLLLLFWMINAEWIRIIQDNNDWRNTMEEKNPPSSWACESKYCETPLVSFEFHNPIVIPSIFNFWKKLMLINWHHRVESNEIFSTFLGKTAKSARTGIDKWILEIEFKFHLRYTLFQCQRQNQNPNRRFLIGHHLLISWFMHSMHMNLIWNSEKLFLKKLRICLHFSVWLSEVKVTEIRIFFFEKENLVDPLSQHLFIQCTHFDMITSTK